MEIRLGKTGRACAATERPFEHGDDVVSVAKLEHEELTRRDYAKRHWDPECATGALAVWATRYVDPKVAEQTPPDVYSPLRQVFYRAADSDDRVELAKAYLAAQLLRRQRVFRLIKESDEEDGDARVALFADRITDRFVEVRDPNLSYEEMEAGRTALIEALGDLENPGEQMAESEDGEREQA